MSAYCTLSVKSYPSTSAAFQSYRKTQLTATLAPDQMLAVYSGWKSVDNYDTCASVFVVLFNGFVTQVTLMLCTDINFTETTYSCQFGNQ
jgi:hypothetical protein